MLESYRVGLLDVADVAVVAVLLWSGIALLRRTRARLALIGFAILGGVYLVARQIGLKVTAGILQGFFAVFVIVVVVVFQDDLRRFFEQIGSWGLRRRPRALPPGVADILVRTATALAGSRIGALLVLPGRDDLERHLDGGIELGGRLSEPILLSLFDASSPGHDGAVVVRGDRIERFAAHLPLSSDHAQLGPGGTRHAAALGLAERSDALCVVVSEERGTVSVACQGRLRVLGGPEELSGELRNFSVQTAVPDEPETLWHRLRLEWKQAALSIGLAVVLWVLFVPGSTMTEVSRVVPVVIENFPAGFVLEEVDPPEVEVTFVARQRDLYLANRSITQARVDAFLVKLGRRTFELSPEQLVVPPGLGVLTIVPDKVRLSVSENRDSDGPAGPKPRSDD
jgi:uncharacterized protein (TIGR00159 family)